MKDIKMGQDKQIKVFKMCVTKFIDKKVFPFFTQTALRKIYLIVYLMFLSLLF